MSRHPGDAQLAVWMTGGPDDGIGDHVDGCPRCADALATLDDDTTRLPDAFVDALTPDVELEQRVLDGVTTTLADRAVAETFLGLLGLGVETARIVFDREERR